MTAFNICALSVGLSFFGWACWELAEAYLTRRAYRQASRK
jgi:hypothetical protein